MQFNPLIDIPPDEFQGHPIDVSFRAALECFRIFSDEFMSKGEQAYTCAMVLFDSELTVLNLLHEGMFEFIAWYLRRGEDVEEEEDIQEKYFDILKDSERIFAAFRQAYRIDLRTEDLHYWDFISLLNNIPEDTRFSQIIRIRSMDIPKRTTSNAKEVDNLRELQDKYRLDNESHEEALQNKARAVFDAWQ